MSGSSDVEVGEDSRTLKVLTQVEDTGHRVKSPLVVALRSQTQSALSPIRKPNPGHEIRVCSFTVSVSVG